MKRMLAVLLCLCFLLAGCARQTGTAPGGGTETPAAPVTPAPGGETETPPEPAPSGADGYEALALGLAALPDLPQEPDESALWEQMNGKSDAQRQELWDAYSRQQEAYCEALDALRGEGVDAALKGAFASFTARAERQLFDGARDRNVVCSPANLYLALCMLAEVSDGDSRAQVLGLLGLADAAQARSAANALWRCLYRDGASGRTLLANSIWLNERAAYRQETVDTLANDYYASVFRAAMGERATDEAIRGWIDANTNGLLRDAAPGPETDADTLMLLLSTLCFKGAWSEPFKEHDTAEDVFTAASGAEQRVGFMHRTDGGSYYRGEGFTIASLPFRDGVSMWFLLPDEGASLRDVLTAEDRTVVDTGDTGDGVPAETPFRAAVAMQGYADIRWSVPRFDAASDLDLIPALTALGVTDVFTDSADFSPLTEIGAYLSAARHAARVKVDEEGCEAAAFTAMMAEPTAMMPEQRPVVEMNLNRPFCFLITGADGLPLFTGVVNTMD